MKRWAIVALLAVLTGASSCAGQPSGVAAGDPPSASPTPSVAPGAVTQPAPTPSPTPTPTRAAEHATPPALVPAPVIVIDPGHSGRSIRSRTSSGLLDFDYPNQPELVEVFDVSACVAAGLRADGYRVIMTKQRATDTVGLAERARIANKARADLAISVHDDHSQGPTFQATYSQLGARHPDGYHPMYRGTGSRRTVFDRPSVAKASDRAAKIIAAARTAAQGREVHVRENSFDGRAPLEPGNLALVQLLSEVPWVYNELGAYTGGSPSTRLSLAAETGYAKGLIEGIEAAVPVAGRSAGHQARTSTAELRSCLQQRRG